MRILIIGAGASIEEAIRVNAPHEYYPPTMVNFAKKLWDSPPLQFTNYWLPLYLQENGIESGSDPTKTFITLEQDSNNHINMERLFEYCWNNKGKLFEDDWQNLVYHGITTPLDFVLAQAFFVNGKGLKRLEAGPLVAKRLEDGDLVLNLNYDTLFEIGLDQDGRTFTYVPHKFTGSGVLVAKPHGSMNLLADDKQLAFAQADCIGAVPSSENKMRNYNSIVPPRFNKEYTQHPIAELIIKAIDQYRPTVLTYWGVGLTDSDTDLLRLYKNWAVSTQKVEVINPDKEVANIIEKTLNKNTTSYKSLDDWLRDNITT
jgi:hypothetical protein